MANSTPPTPAAKRAKLCFDVRDPSITPLPSPTDAQGFQFFPRPACGRRLDFGGPSNLPDLDNTPEECKSPELTGTRNVVSTPNEKSWGCLKAGQFVDSPTVTPIPRSSVSRQLVYKDTPAVKNKTVRMEVAGICRLPPSPKKEQGGKKK